ncbi:MAG: hypothetical protein COA94_04725 [Rickettsiales bacterium]|nr:MAG: hypothetical protein COA94_04725 [Rickettsiales bacterium]
MNILQEHELMLKEDSPVYTSAQYEEEKASGDRKDDGSRKLLKLTPRHEEMIAMHLDGMRNKDIASAYQITDSTISIFLKDPLVLAVISEARVQNEARFASLYGKVVDVIEDSVNGAESIDIRLKGASLYLKEVGNKPVGERKTAEDVVQQIINMQINGDIVVKGA